MARWFPVASLIGAPILLLIIALILPTGRLAIGIAVLVGRFAATLVDPVAIICAVVTGFIAVRRLWVLPIGMVVAALIYVALTSEWQRLLGASQETRSGYAVWFAAVVGYLAFTVRTVALAISPPPRSS
jgi:hypothetical protein